MAGDIGRPSNFHYGAAKSALTNYGQGLFYRCIGKPFKVRVIKAGLVNTSMSIGKYPKILLANKNYIAKTLLKRPYKDGIEYLPWWWFFVMKIISIMPRF